jgi:hypothetical protein
MTEFLLFAPATGQGNDKTMAWKHTTRIDPVGGSWLTVPMEMRSGSDGRGWLLVGADSDRDGDTSDDVGSSAEEARILAWRVDATGTGSTLPSRPAIRAVSEPNWQEPEGGACFSAEIHNATNMRPNESRWYRTQTAPPMTISNNPWLIFTGQNDSIAEDDNDNPNNNPRFEYGVYPMPWYGTGNIATATTRYFPAIRVRDDQYSPTTLAVMSRAYLWIWTGGGALGTYKAEGGIRMQNHYILGVDASDELVKLWSITSSANLESGGVIDAGGPDAEQAKFSGNSVDPTTMTSAMGGPFLTTDAASSGTVSGQQYTFSNEVPFLLTNGTTNRIEYSSAQLEYRRASGTSGSVRYANNTGTAFVTIGSTDDGAGNRASSVTGTAAGTGEFTVESGGAGSDMLVKALGTLTLQASGIAQDVVIQSVLGGRIELVSNSHMNDNIKLVLGTGNDAEVYYDGSDLVVDPDVGGSGSVKIPAATPLWLDHNNPHVEWGEPNASASVLEFACLNSTQLNARYEFQNQGGDALSFVVQTTAIQFSSSAGLDLVFESADDITFTAPGGDVNTNANNLNFTGSSAVTFDMPAVPSLTTNINSTGTGPHFVLANTSAFASSLSISLNSFLAPAFNRMVANNAFEIATSSGNLSFAVPTTADIIFNDGATADVDVRMETAGETHGFFLQGSTDRAGFQTSSPASGLDAGGSFGFGIKEVSSSTTAGEGDCTILCDATSGAITVTLPAAAGVPRRIYNVKKIDGGGNAITIDGNGAETIDGSTTVVFSAPNQTVSIQSDGTEWWIV